MARTTHQYTLTIFEPSVYLKEKVRRFAEDNDHLLRNIPDWNQDKQNALLDYNTVPVMHAVLDVIFSKAEAGQSDHRTDYDLRQVKALMREAGIGNKCTDEVVDSIFSQCVDIISVIPTIVFNPQVDIQYGIFNEFDLMITVVFDLEGEDNSLPIFQRTPNLL